MSLHALIAELSGWSPLEVLAAVLALAYLVLAARQNIWCWLCAFVSTALYFGLFLDRHLYQQSLLQIFYLAMAVYGYMHWRRGPGAGAKLPITRWPLGRHLQAAAAVTILTLITGGLEARFTNASLPYLDAFTTWGSAVTTWMVARKVIENWLYWLVVDGISAYVYFLSGLPATMLLFVIYLGIVVAGYISWRRTLRATAPA